jgi:tetratricopeptide (TPR) repeat protein
VFDVLAQPPLSVKGLDEPLATYLVQRAKPRAFRVATRGIEGVETRMIGRDVELEQLQNAFKRVYREGGLINVIVVGEAGLGKSRLLYEFENWAEARPEAFYVFQGRAHPQTQSRPYGLLRDVFAWRLQIADSDSMDEARCKVEQGIAPLFEPDDGVDMALAQAHVLGHLIGLDFARSPHVEGIKSDARQIRDRGFHAAAQALRRIASQNQAPVVLLLDDLHYCDDGSLDFLQYLCRVNRDVPMLVLCLTRPALFERRGDASDAGQHRIDLRPFEAGTSEQLADELLKMLGEVPATLRDMIANRAQGNPFYMEELVKMLIDEGAIRAGAQHWSVVPDKLVTTRVPGTLTGVLQARLDGLRRAEKLALQQASVIGHVFWDQALAAIDAVAPQALATLSQRELTVAHQDTALAGLREYAFKHQILHQVVYDTVLKPTRRVWHALAAAWLSGLRGARANDFLGATAEHYDKAGNREQACEFFTRAAEHARDRFAHEAALDYAKRALGLLDDSTPPAALLDPTIDASLRWRLLDLREHTHDLQGQRDAQQADLDALHAVADTLDDDCRRAETASRRGVFAMRIGDFAAQERFARQALEFAGRIDEPVLRLRAQRQLASALAYQGDIARGKAIAQEGLAAARGAGLRALEPAFLNTLSVIASMQDDQFERLVLLEEILPIDRELGNRRDVAINLSNLGAALLSLGQPALAQRPLEDALRMARAIGDRLSEPYTLAMLSELWILQGNLAQALSYAQAAVALGNDVQSAETQAIALCTLGSVEHQRGNHGEAAAAFERAHQLAASIGDALQYDALAGIARALLAQDRLTQATQLVEQLLSRMNTEGSLEGAGGPHLIELTCYQVLARAADSRAPEVLRRAHGQLQAKAAAISDPAMRRSFLSQVPEHREIVAAWQALR